MASILPKLDQSVPFGDLTGNAVLAFTPKAAAAPATVSGKTRPIATGCGTASGKGVGLSKTREPGDLPTVVVTREHASGGVPRSLTIESGFVLKRLRLR